MSRQKSKKILMFAKRYDPSIGGVEKHIKSLNQVLTKDNKFQISIITEKYTSELKGFDKKNNINIFRIKTYKVKYLGLLGIWLSLVKFIPMILSADIIHIHDIFIWYLPFRILFFWKPTYITFHGWDGVYPVPKMHKFQKKLAMFLTDGNIMVGEYLKKYYGLKSDYIMYGAIDQDILKINTNDKKKNSFVYVGRLNSDTGLAKMLQFFKIMNLRNIIFCGDGNLRRECQKYGRVLGFTDPIPYIAKSEYCFAGGYLTAYDCFALKSQVVIMHDNPLKEYCFKKTPFFKYIISETDLKTAQFKLTKLMKNPIARKKNAEVAFNWVKNKTWDNIAQQYIQLWIK